MKAAERWKQALAAWAIPPAILAAAPESPWGFPTELFERRADAVPAEPTPSTQRALEALPEGGSVLDVGCGAGAASLPLAARAGHLIGVDPSAEMLRAFRRRVE
ncbi:MAG TPA: class I SAM-dependent methyltransferase, partial [Chloroflexota bacterium]|nr:class I SAM-dependent methyltransferase [Chloroflexota bacterium]